MVKRLNFFNALNSDVFGDPKITLAELTYPKGGVDCLAPYFFLCVCVCVVRPTSGRMSQKTNIDLGHVTQ